MIEDYLGRPLSAIPQHELNGYQCRPVLARPEHLRDALRTGRLMAVQEKTLYIGYFKDGQPRQAEKQV